MSSNRFVILAGEASGDMLGAELVRQMSAAFPQAEFVGMVGEKMRVAGCQQWWHIDEMSVMGIVEVIKHLPRLLRLRRQMFQRILDYQPTAVVTIDCPDFFLALDKRLKQHKVRVYQYVCPTVWAWKPKRALALPQQVDGLLAMFPQEQAFFAEQYFSFQFVGHPLAQQIPLPPSLDKNQQGEVKNLAILPGSRFSEVKRLMPIFADVIAALNATHPDIQLTLAAYSEGLADIIKSFLLPAHRIHIEINNTERVLQRSDLALVMSGTASLQTALYKTPLVIVARVARLSYLIYKAMMVTKLIGLPNILIGRKVAPELIQDAVTVENCMAELNCLIAAVDSRQAQVQAFTKLHQSLMPPEADILGKTLTQWIDTTGTSNQ